MTTATNEKARIMAALDAWIRQRPGLDFGNYGDARSYNAELRSIGRDLAEARTLLRAVETSGMPADCLREGFRAFSGRLSWDGAKLTYCTGQYWPTEYRRAACAVLASALWMYHRPDVTGDDQGGQLRRKFRRMFGRGLASRWFA
jgi:hypothetical protein